MEKGTTQNVASTADGTATITLTAANSKIEKGQLVSGPGVLDETVVKSINGTTLTLTKEQPRVPAGAKLVFTNPSFINREVFVDSFHKSSTNLGKFSTQLSPQKTSSQISFGLNRWYLDCDLV